MATFVLVHGAAHGGWCWRKVTPLLRAAGHDVHAPTLTGLGERAHLANPDVDLELHVKDVANVLQYEDLRGVVLVGHGYAGLVVAGVADRIPERVAHVVYLDAAVTDGGRSLLDLLGADARAQVEADARDRGGGWRQPIDPARAVRAYGITDPDDAAWLADRLVPQPIRTFSQPLRLTHPLERVARTFVYCTDKAPGDPLAAAAAWARPRPGWSYRELPTGHDAMVTMPRELATLLVDIAQTADG